MFPGIITHLHSLKFKISKVKGKNWERVKTLFFYSQINISKQVNLK